MTDPAGTSTQRPPRKRGRTIPLAMLCTGMVATLVGVSLTIISAWQVWRQIDSAPADTGPHGATDMNTYFAAMNHVAGISVGVAVTGLVIVIASMLALSRNKSAP